MKSNVSILIPTFNTECFHLVQSLYEEASKINYLKYEIVVADDGSTNKEIIVENSKINKLPNCSYKRNHINIGRAKIRNFLAKQARFKWLIFIDSDMKIQTDDFIWNYINTPDIFDVVVGGYALTYDKNVPKYNLRYCYEEKFALIHNFKYRKQYPYLNFHTANFMISKRIMEKYPFNERIKYYGYEDVLLGKTLSENNISLLQIDNPVFFTEFETNEQFLKKTEQALETLKMFSNELNGYSKLLAIYQMISKLHLKTIFELIFNKTKNSWREKLIEDKPNILLFNLYKLLYYISL